MIDEHRTKKYFTEGLKLFQEKKYKEAIVSFEKSIEILPDIGLTHYYLAQSYHNTGNIDKAVSEYKKVLEINPNNPGPYVYLADIYVKREKTDDAIELYKKSLPLFKDDNKGEKIETLKKIAWLYQERGLLGQAISFYEEAVKTNPYNVKAYFDLATVYDKNSQEDKALLAYEKAESLFYTKSYQEQMREGYFKKTYNILGKKYAKRRLIYKAVRKYKKALRINKDYKEAMDNMKSAEETIKESDRYVKEAEKKIEDKLLNDALSDLKKAVEINAENIRAYFNIGKVYYQMKAIDDAIKNYEKAVSLDEEYRIANKQKFALDMYNGLGMAYYESNAFDKAIVEYMKVIAVNTNYPDIYENIRNAYYKSWE